MNKRSVLLISLAILLTAGYVYFNFSDWFAPATIEIAHDIRPSSPTAGRKGARNPMDDSTANTVAFFFTAKYKLTSVKVVALDELKTNKYAHPLWHLISDSNSVPVKSIIYGVPIRGMKPAVKGARPELLQPEVPYRLLVEAGSLKGEHDFQSTEKTQPAP
ncbi:MAG: hypothetical protein HY298_26925 [Verrucomicrobia bacterium]|nr:hypothetical protein [Verrucomicrobiota bacterium]